MFKNLRVKKEPPKATPVDLTLSGLQTASDQPISIRSLNRLHPNIKARIYRALVPHALLGSFLVDPITWKGPGKEPLVQLHAEDGSSKVLISVFAPSNPADPFFTLELEDNGFNGIDLNLLVLTDPSAERFNVDIDAHGNSTMYGTMSRNLPEEARAKAAGLAPAQVRAGIKGSETVLQQVEGFLVGLGHRAFYLEPLTYVSAWVFERRGFAYTKGHKLMETIHQEFQPGGHLQAALDGSTPFRQPDQWCTVRGRAWAIHDGILDVIEARWDDLRMVKQLGRRAGVQTFPEADY